MVRTASKATMKPASVFGGSDEIDRSPGLVAGRLSPKRKSGALDCGVSSSIDFLVMISSQQLLRQPVADIGGLGNIRDDPLLPLEIREYFENLFCQGTPRTSHS